MSKTLSVRKLVQKLNEVNGALPVVMLTNEGIIPISRNFMCDDDGWNQFELSLDREEKEMQLDTLFLMHILDYSNSMITASFFNGDAQFVDYEVLVTERDESSDIIDEDDEENTLYVNTLHEISAAYVRKIDGEVYFVLERLEF